MAIELDIRPLSKEQRASLRGVVDDYFNARVGHDMFDGWDNDAGPDEFVGFVGSANLLRHLSWEGYEYGFSRASSFERLVGLSVACMAKLLGLEVGTVSVAGSKRLAVLAKSGFGRPLPLMMHEYLITLLATNVQEQFDDWYADALTRSRADWGSEVFPALCDSPWCGTYFGVEIPGPVERAFLAANKRCRGSVGEGTGVARRLGLRVPLAIIEKDWDSLLRDLDSLPVEYVG